MKSKYSTLVILIIIFLILNIYIFVRQQIKKKQIAPKRKTELTGLKGGDIAPSFILKDLKEKPRSIAELKDKIALLIFCNIEDEKSLLEAYYYKLLLGKYKDKGLVAWVVSNSQGKIAPQDLDKIYSPILILKDEDGKVTKQYCNKKENRFEVFAVDREGIIRFRDYDLPNLAIRMTVEQLIPPEEHQEEFVKDKNLPSLEYYEVNSNKNKRLEEFKGAPVLLTLFSANCPTCKEDQRLSFMREVHQEYGPKGLMVILIYGKDNPSNIIRDYVQEAKLFFAVGVRKVEPGREDSYYQNYDLKVDPKSIIINSEGRTIYVEELKDDQEIIKRELEDLFKPASK